MSTPAQRAHAHAIGHRESGRFKAGAKSKMPRLVPDDEPDRWVALVPPCAHCGKDRGVTLNGQVRCRACGYPA
jgi:hypothetical protein